MKEKIKRHIVTDVEVIEAVIRKCGIDAYDYTLSGNNEMYIVRFNTRQPDAILDRVSNNLVSTAMFEVKRRPFDHRRLTVNVIQL